MTAPEIRERVLAEKKRKVAILNTISALATLDPSKNSAKIATTDSLRAIKFDSLGNSKLMTLGKNNLGVSQPKWGCSESGQQNNKGNVASGVFITNNPAMEVPTTPTTYVQPNPPISDLEYHPNLNMVKQVANTGNMIFGPASYITMPQLASEFF